jgi:glutamate racemase
MNRPFLLLLCILALSLCNCSYKGQQKNQSSYSNAFLNRVLNDPSDFFYLKPKNISDSLAYLPIGMFDSGTGGLTVLNALIDFDHHNNNTHAYEANGDGIRDFLTESFIYFGDQANMPYGNYAKMDKSGYLKELVLKDVLFLLGNKYWRSPSDTSYQTDKQGVKLIVIACNTATAYGKDEIERMFVESNSNMKVIGVIDAGVRGALASFAKDEDGTVAVMATAGTVTSEGYVHAFHRLKKQSGFSGDIQIIQQGCPGIAEAVDEEANFIDRKATKPRQNYRGPGFDTDEIKIEKELLRIYQFNKKDNGILCDFQDERCNMMQLNSPENYMKFYLVSLCEQLRKKPGARPLKTIILGCTHYPFLTDFIKKTLTELYHLKIDGKYIYRDFLSDSIQLIDPAINTAKEVYDYLVENNLLKRKGDINNSEFYISEPVLPNPDLKTDAPGRFSYDYKYSRGENNALYDTKQIPMSRKNLPEEVIVRLRQQIPNVFEIMRKFNQVSPKTKFLEMDKQL